MPPEHVYGLPAGLLPPPAERPLPLPAALYERIATSGSFRPRDEVESDEGWRQIIPYAVVMHEGRLLLAERLAAGSEARLHAKLSLGMGGHVEPVDARGADDPVRAGLARELGEELEPLAWRAEAVALIHSAADPVSRVHTGVLFRVVAASPPVVRERDKLAGRLVTPAEARALAGRLEGWSRIALEVLADGLR